MGWRRRLLNAVGRVEILKPLGTALITGRPLGLQAFASAAAKAGCIKGNAVADQASQATEVAVAKAVSSSGESVHETHRNGKASDVKTRPSLLPSSWVPEYGAAYAAACCSGEKHERSVRM